MYGEDDSLLYVGKSIRVRTRLLSYFRAPPDEKPGELIRESRRIEWDHIPDEFGALVREMRLIQRHRPRFNVQHKRKRNYAFVKVTREGAPRVLPVTRVARDGAHYYGPFPRVGRVGQTVRDLAHVLGLRDCAGTLPIVFADQLDIFGADRAPKCLRADLGTCLAPCCGRVDAASYGARVRDAHRFLEGRSSEPLDRLAHEMTEAARRLDFEYAAVLRDRLERLGRFQEELTAFRGEVRALSFVYRAVGHNGAERLYLIKGGRVRDHFPVPRTEATRRRARRRVELVFSDPDPGPGSLSPYESAEIILVARWFRQKPTERARTSPPREWLGDADLERGPEGVEGGVHGDGDLLGLTVDRDRSLEGGLQRTPHAVAR